MEAYMCADEFAGCTSPVILFSSHEQKIASTEANEEKRYGAADGCARGASNALWPVHHLWIQGPRAQEEAVALVPRNVDGKTAPLVRVHSQCLTGDVLTSLRCDCRRAAAGIVAQENRPGIVWSSAVSPAGRPASA